MNSTDIATLTLWLAREVARLHGLTASLSATIQELRIVDHRLAVVDAAQIQIDELQKFYEYLEKLNPKIAALIDNRSARAFDVDGDPTQTFPR